MWIVWKVLGFLTQLLIVEHSLHTLTLIQTKSMIDISSKHSIATSRAEDDLFGIFSQLEMLLNKDLIQEPILCA
jgi:hypothetical protein